MSHSPPGIHLFYDPHWQGDNAIDELCWGMEEQGVPCHAICCQEGGDATILSKLAARSSPLRVGLGICAAGNIMLTHAQLPEEQVLLKGHMQSGSLSIRILGTNAGQLVKVLPFSEVK